MDLEVPDGAQGALRLAGLGPRPYGEGLVMVKNHHRPVLTGAASGSWNAEISRGSPP